MLIISKLFSLILPVTSSGKNSKIEPFECTFLEYVCWIGKCIFATKEKYIYFTLEKWEVIEGEIISSLKNINKHKGGHCKLWGRILDFMILKKKKTEHSQISFINSGSYPNYSTLNFKIFFTLSSLNMQSIYGACYSSFGRFFLSFWMVETLYYEPQFKCMALSPSLFS